MPVTVSSFGRCSDGREAKLYTITGSSDISLCVTDFGAALVSLWAPDRNGVPLDVVLGYDSVSGYEANGGSLGGTCGRFANRIAFSRLTLGSGEYGLSPNDANYTIHGGEVGFHKKLWQGQAEGDGVTFTLLSPDGDMGFPGDLMTTVRYELSSEGALIMDYRAVSSQDTVINLTNHAYFNLSGHASGDTHQLLSINADFFNPQDSRHLPTGEVLSLDGSVLDFRCMKDAALAYGSDDPQIIMAGGLDHNYLLNRPFRGAMTHAGTLYSPVTGIRMDVSTTMPAMMVYAANFLNVPGKHGTEYLPHQAVCMECQYVPDSPRHTHFPSPVLKAGQQYRETTCCRFTVE